MKNHVFTCMLLTGLFTLGTVASAMAESPAETARESLEKYVKSWNEPNVEKRRALLAKAWSEKGTYTDPTAHVEGRAALVDHIGEFLANPQFKGCSMLRSSGVEVHHKSLRFEWKLTSPTGSVLAAGMDYGEFNEKGEITKIVGFFGPFPPMK